jgi:hypothetical protein
VELVPDERTQAEQGQPGKIEFVPINGDPLLQGQKEGRFSTELITLAGEVGVNPDIGRMEKGPAAALAEMTSPCEGCLLHAGPTPEVARSDGKEVIVARVQEGREARRMRLQLQHPSGGKAHPYDDLVRPDRNPSRPDVDLIFPLQKRQLTQDSSHAGLAVLPV